MRSAFVARLKEKGGDNNVMGVGDDWRFDYDPEIAYRGWYIFHTTGIMPTAEDVMRMDPRFESDILLVERLYRWVNDKSGIVAAVGSKS